MTTAAAESSRLIVAIDGPSGVGKSTVARRVSERLGVPYLSTGAMYRAVALKVLELGMDPEDEDAVSELTGTISLRLVPVGTRLKVQLDGADPGRAAYSLEVSRVTSRISTYPGVRQRMVELQREGAAQEGAVLEGRDIGTRVFPETPHKFYLEASPEIRAERRWLQLGGSNGTDLLREQVLREVLERDQQDSTRSESPLTWDASYTLVDTDSRSVDEVVSFIVECVTRQESESSS